MNKKSWLIGGFIAYLLSLPILIWRSSKIGKIIFILFGGFAFIHILQIVISLGISTYSRITIIGELIKTKQNIVELDLSISETRKRLVGFNKNLDEQAKTVSEDVRASLTERLSLVNEQLSKLETATSDLKKDERERVKNRIIEIKEQVRLLNKPLESAEIRKQVEEIIPGLKLLREDEKERFLADLNEIGFELNGEKKKANEVWVQSQKYQSYYSGNLASGTVVLFSDQ